MRELRVSTERRSQLVDITRQVREAVAGEDGAAVLVYVPHTTAGVTLNERIDHELVADLERVLERIAGDPAEYSHDDADGPNGPAHLRSTIVGTHVLIPLREAGELAIGSYQAIFFCEFDGPRDRSVYVSVLR